MGSLCFLPVSGGSAGQSRRPVVCAVPPRGDALLLRVEPGGELAGLPAAARRSGSRGVVVAELRSLDSSAGAAWWLTPRTPSLAVNGVPPLSLAALDPGDLLSIDSHWWWVSSLWRTEPGPAPPAVADRPCPVCGGPLKAAPVCQCPCGRFFHLESPENTADEQALNCYLAGPCGLCGRQPSLDPVLCPEPPARLIDIVE